MGIEDEKFFVGVKKNADGAPDYSKAATVPDNDGSLAKNAEKNKIKEETEKEMGFEWERALERRFNELSIKSSKQGLSDHGSYELSKLEKVLDLLRKT